MRYMAWYVMENSNDDLMMCENHVHGRCEAGHWRMLRTLREAVASQHPLNKQTFCFRTMSKHSCSYRQLLQMALKPVCEMLLTQWKNVDDLSTTRMAMLSAIRQRSNIVGKSIFSLSAAVFA